MSGFYRRPVPEAAIGQGDLFIDVPIIGVSLTPMYHATPDGDKFRVEQIEPDQISPGAILLEQIALTKAIVIT